MTKRVAIGVMSGTSADGADAVAIEVDPAQRSSARVLGHAFLPFPDDVRERLVNPGCLTAREISELHFALPELYATVAKSLAAFPDAEVCGCHGQTLVHEPPSAGRARAHSLKIGSSAVLAARLGIPVVGDLRGADLALGGEGAPIVPFAHWFFSAPDAVPSLVVNLGGIANFTWVTERVEDVVSYDAGPGMMVSDAWAVRSTGGVHPCDRDGKLSRGGVVQRDLVATVVAHPFVSRPSPKSTGREDFGPAFYEPLFERFADRPSADVAASLLEATARILEVTVRGDDRVTDPTRVILTGGGAKNPVLVEAISRRFAPWIVDVADGGPLAPSIHEPAAMALIAARTLSHLPSSLPSVTGASRGAVLGHIHHPV